MSARAVETGTAGAPAFVMNVRLARATAWTRRLIARLDDTRAIGLAAETAFWLFLSLIPLAAVAGLVAARFSVHNWRTVAPLLGSFPEATRQLISAELLRLAAWNRGNVGILNTAVFVWLASTGVHSIFDSLEIQAGASRPWWKKRLLALGTCVLLSIAIAILALLGAGLAISNRLFRFGAGAIVVFSYVCALYAIGVPPVARRRMPIVPGAVVAVVLEVLFGFAYASYLATVGDSGAYLAGLAAIGVTMIALYLFTLALLTGAVVNRLLARPDH
ncbi:MAG: YihY/virulence factor BrkB family protein [Polyangiales bacterium]